LFAAVADDGLATCFHHAGPDEKARRPRKPDTQNQKYDELQAARQLATTESADEAPRRKNGAGVFNNAVAA
jgi:hypothetical protein